jgi:GTPase
LEQARELAALSFDTGRQIGLLIDRRGRPQMVILGDAASILIPDLSRARRGTGRLRGLRLLHTHLTPGPLSHEDLMDLLFLRLDSLAALTVGRAGEPLTLHYAHLLPSDPEGKGYRTNDPLDWDRVDVDFPALALALEDELGRGSDALDAPGEAGRALLVGVSSMAWAAQEASLAELSELARTAGLSVAGSLAQRVAKVNPKYILGKGALADLEVRALQVDADVILFDRELSPAQLNNLAELTERKVLDRTQLILDIFAQHAVSRAGKLQVEMAQLKYSLPRLIGKNKALSRLAGGIGGRGPGETKLELDRRAIRTRTARIKGELEKLRRHRAHARGRRARAGAPVAALVGYTNAGKSTLLNVLTRSDVRAENKLFATLDPTSRRLRIPQERELILTDTVGFIRRLPEELKEAFRATLEELESADLLLHVVDASHPEAEEQMEAVQGILDDLGLLEIPCVLVLNKWDATNPERREVLSTGYPDGLSVSALKKQELETLSRRIAGLIDWEREVRRSRAHHPPA